MRPSAVRAACTLRTGGVSAAPYETLNLGQHVGDDPAAVAENRARLRAALSLAREPLWLEQVHGTRIADADREIEPARRRRCGHSGSRARARDPGGRLPAGASGQCRWERWWPPRTPDGGASPRACWKRRSPRCGPNRSRSWPGSARPSARITLRWARKYAPPFWRTMRVHRKDLCRNARGRWQCDLPQLARRRLAALGVREVGSAAPLHLRGARSVFLVPARVAHRTHGRAHLALPEGSLKVRVLEWPSCRLSPG